MVRLHTSLLAVTLATGSALASSNEYQRRSELDNQVQSREFEQGPVQVVPHRYFRFGHACARTFGQNNFQSRGFVDEEDLFERDLDAFDDLEAREPFGFKTAAKVFKFGSKVAKHKHTKNAFKAVDYGQQIAGAFQSRGLEDDEELFVRDLDAFDDLEAREPLGFKAAAKVFKFGSKVAKHKHTKNALKAVDYGQQIYGAFQSRGLEDDEELFVRDLDAFDDLEAREPFGFKAAAKVFKFGAKVAKHKHTKNAFKAVDYGQQIAGAFQSRGLEDDEDLFGRDLDAEEFFGREYDLFDERDIIDDLD